MAALISALPSPFVSFHNPLDDVTSHAWSCYPNCQTLFRKHDTDERHPNANPCALSASSSSRTFCRKSYKTFPVSPCGTASCGSIDNSLRMICHTLCIQQVPSDCVSFVCGWPHFRNTVDKYRTDQTYSGGSWRGNVDSCWTRIPCHTLHRYMEGASRDPSSRVR